MKKSMLTSTLLATLLLSTSYSTLASNSIFQVAVVKGAVGTTDLTEGKVESGIKKLTSSEKTQDFYANKMNLCVAYLQSDLSHSNKSESACTDAINTLESVKRQSNKVKFLTALNYSNRGVARYRKNQLVAALADFKAAVAIDQNLITNANLASIRQLLPATKVDSNVELSD